MYLKVQRYVVYAHAPRHEASLAFTATVLPDFRRASQLHKQRRSTVPCTRPVRVVSECDPAAIQKGKIRVSGRSCVGTVPPSYRSVWHTHHSSLFFVCVSFRNVTCNFTCTVHKTLRCGYWSGRKPLISFVYVPTMFYE